MIRALLDLLTDFSLLFLAYALAIAALLCPQVRQASIRAAQVIAAGQGSPLVVRPVPAGKPAISSPGPGRRGQMRRMTWGR